MQPPPERKGPSNPYARRSPWGRMPSAPFRLGPLPKGPTVPPPGRAAPSPVGGQGILGSSPLLPRPAVQAEVRPRAEPAPQPAPGPQAPHRAVAEPSPLAAAPPIADLAARGTRLDPPRAPSGRQLAIGGVAAGVLAVVAAAVVASGRNAEIADTTPSAAPTASVAFAPTATGTSLETPTIPAAAPVDPAPPLIAPPAATTALAATSPTPTAATTAAVPAVPEPTLPPPTPVILTPVVEAPTPRPAAPPPAATRPPEDPDAPIILREGDS